MACSRECENENCDEWIDWQDTVEPYELDSHIRLSVVPGDVDHKNFPSQHRPGGYFCSKECLIEWLEDKEFEWL